jgi:competence protein ComEA
MNVLWAIRGKFLAGLLLAGLIGGTVVAQAAVGRPNQAVAEKDADSKGLVDINRATAEELSGLPGMGVEYARRVIAGRPYSAKSQLVQRGILPQSAYETVKDSIIAHRVKK